jgi:surfactin synthase thioesterase subunit
LVFGLKRKKNTLFLKFKYKETILIVFGFNNPQNKNEKSFFKSEDNSLNKDIRKFGLYYNKFFIS